MLSGWVKKEIGAYCKINVIKNFRSELELFSAQHSNCVLLDADYIPELYLKILNRLTEKYSIPVVILYRKKRISEKLKYYLNNCRFINIIDGLNRLSEILAECFADDTAEYIIRRKEIPSLSVESFDEESQKMKQFKNLVSRAAQSEYIVLLTGESGVGKTYTAEYIHNHSVRKEKEMQYLNVADIAPSLAESELFGVEKGAYTNAVVKPGIFEVSEGSSLLLDEIGELPVHLQTKLLDVIETKSFRKVGSFSRRYFDTRLIFATNADLQKKMAHGQFRRDLFYRISVLPIEVPPLREHIEDMPVFVKKFLPFRNLTNSALDKLCSYAWPGNIRELKNVLNRAEAFCCGEVIHADDILFY